MFVLLLFFLTFHLTYADEPTVSLTPEEEAELQDGNTPFDEEAELKAISETIAESQNQICENAKCDAEKAFLNPKTYKPCAGQTNHELRKKAFCDTAKTVINPIALATMPSLKGTSACRMYLFKKAEQQVSNAQVTEITSLVKDFSKPWQDIEQVVCEQPSLTRLMSQVNDVFIHNTDSSKQYCKIALCNHFGGKFEKIIGGKQACVKNGIAIDESCLNLKESQRKKLRFALQDIKNHGGSCLNKLGGDAAKASIILSAHLKGDAKTALCCGKTCKDTTIVFPTKIGMRDTILLDETTLKKSNKAVASEIFSGMLRRVGVAKNPDHFIYSKRKVYPIKSNEECSQSKYPRYKKMTANELRAAAVKFSLRRETYTAFANRNPFSCVAMSECSKQDPLFIVDNPFHWDPLYACQEACYPSTESSAQTASEFQGTVNTCKLFAGSENFTGAFKLEFTDHEGKIFNVCDE